VSYFTLLGALKFKLKMNFRIKLAIMAVTSLNLVALALFLRPIEKMMRRTKQMAYDVHKINGNFIINYESFNLQVGVRAFSIKTTLQQRRFYFSMFADGESVSAIEPPADWFHGFWIL
jgi:hypothetical protein